MKTGTMTTLAAIAAAQDANDTFRMMKHSLGPFGWRTLSTGVENPKVLQPKRPRDHGPFAARGARCREQKALEHRQAASAQATNIGAIS